MQFKDIIGQDFVKARLIKSVTNQRISHAQLFLGPAGSGKLATAMAYAQYINCTDKQENDSCGQCPSCVKYAKFAHPDLHFVFPVATNKRVTSKPLSKDFGESWRSMLLEKNCHVGLNDWHKYAELDRKQLTVNVGQCSEIMKTLAYKTFEAEYKVVVFWMVEKLYHAAAPKLLKILEEPPEKTLFLLISEDQDAIIRTILSRTQMVRFNRLSDGQIAAGLEKEAGLSPDAAMNIGYLADGNFNQALELVQHGEEAQAHFMQFRSWMRLCWTAKLVEIAKLVKEMSVLGREQQKAFLNACLRIVRQIMLYNYQYRQGLKLNPEEQKFVQAFSPFIHEANVLQIIEALDEAIYHVERNANASIMYMDLSMKFATWLKIKRPE